MTSSPQLTPAHGYRNSLNSLGQEAPAYREICHAPDIARTHGDHARGGSDRLAKPICRINLGLSEEAIVEFVIDLLRKFKIDYGDLRLGRELFRSLYLQDTNLSSHIIRETEGIGVRVWHRGHWGFAATSDLSISGLTLCATRATQKAKSGADGKQAESTKHSLSDTTEIKAEFHTPVLICPFSASTKSMTEPLVQGAWMGLEMPAIKRVQSNVECYGRRRFFASTRDARILTTHCLVEASQRFYAVDEGTSAYRTVQASALAGGLEHLDSAAFPEQAKRAAYDARLKCRAPRPPSGLYDLILDPHNLALTMHESVGHPTELDRVLGYELGFAGGSFAKVADLKTLTYGSPLVNFTANNNLLFGGSSTGFDDEGVPCQSFPVIRDGILVGFSNNCETAPLMGSALSNGNGRATSWADVPIVRIPNLFMEPGKRPLSLKQLIADTERGIILFGNDSFSIDQMRANFQFGSDMAYMIEKGQVIGPLKDVIYQSLTTDFWRSCDAVCDASEWQMHGVLNCGKGQPMQLGKMMHGASPARFRQIKVGF